APACGAGWRSRCRVRWPSRSAPRRGGLSVRISAWGQGLWSVASRAPRDMRRRGRLVGRNKVVVRYRGRGSRWSDGDRSFSGIRGLERRPADGRGPWPAVLGRPGGIPGDPSGRPPRSPSGVCAPADRLPRHRIAGGCGYALYSDQRWLSRKTVSCDFDRAPTLLATIEPFLKSISVGMPRTAYLAVVAGFSSTFSFPTWSRPS